MKQIFKSIVALLCCGAMFASCEQEVPQAEMSADLTSIEVAAQNPEEVAVTLTANTSWLLTTPKWVTASATYGSGNTILTFTVEPNYKNETTTTLARQGEIKISGGGALTGKGIVITIPITQQGYTYVDPNPSLGGIPDAEEFVDFIKAANSGGPLKRWSNENGDVVLLADIDLSNTNIDWQKMADEADVTNSNNDCVINCTPFTGVFDGDNHKITGFNPTVVLGSNRTFGLFSVISGATIKNVELTGTMTISATAQSDAGMLVGTAYDATIQNVKVNGKIVSTGTSAAKRYALGGVAGFAMAKDKNTVIEGATVNVEAEAVGGSNTANGATCAMYGGVVGFATAQNAADKPIVVIKNCVNNGNMNVTLGRCSGIVATANTGVTIQGCTNNGDQVNKIANGRLGNIACNFAHYCQMIDCVNNGDIDATAAGYKGTVGGLLALTGSANGCVISGGGNYGTIKTLSTAGKYVGLLWANHNKNTVPTSGLVASGRIFIDGVEVEINASNYMQHLGWTTYPEILQNITWVAPK